MDPLLPGTAIPLTTVWPDGVPSPYSSDDPLPLADETPRRFALCAEEPDNDGWHEVVAWGLEFEEDAMVYLRDAGSGRSSQGIFASADRACAVFGRIAPLRVVWT
jgi:hypothetical protein